MVDIADTVAASIDPNHPVPIYHQVVTVVQEAILSGRLPIGSSLPPVRQIATRAGVNFHTIRGAWAELAAQGVLSIRRGRGAQVIRSPAQPGRSPASDTPPRLWVAGPSLTLAAQVAAQLCHDWRIEATPWPLGREAPPPGIILVAPSDRGAALADWPSREGDLRTAALVPDTQLVPLIQQAAQLLGTNRVALLGEPSDTVLRDLARQLPRIGLAVISPTGAPTDPAALPSGHLLVITLSAWERLPLLHRWHPAVLPLPLGPARGAIGALAREQGWAARES